MNKLFPYIKEGTEILEPMYDIHEILLHYGMDLYGDMCCQRIAGDELIDGTYIMIDFFSPGHIQVDRRGLNKSKDILLSYIQQEDFEQIDDLINTDSTYARRSNDMLRLLRSYSKKKLRKILEEAQESSDEDKERISQFINEDLKSRRFYRKVLRKVKNMGREVIFHFKYRQIFKFSKRYHDHEEPLKCIQKDKSTSYLDAWVRMQKRLGKKINPHKMDKEELIKYIYLGVKALMVKYRSRPKYLDPEYIQNEYSMISSIVEGIGLLTPKEIVQIFPVSKEYDGSRYDTKDYFYTMDTLKKYKPDEPIGNQQEAINLLWEYVNHDISFFMVMRMRCISDLSVYCGIEEPLNEFYKGQEA